MWSYAKRLKRDLPRWRENGWLTAEGEANIVAELARSGREVGLASSLGILASVLLGFAAISFVAAHWQEMPRLARIGLLLSLIWIGYGAAGVLADRGARGLSDAAILFATSVFGASIMLVSQMYHIDGNPPDGVLLWWIGAFIAGLLLRSNPALALTMVLVCVWSVMESSERNAIHWPFLIGWALVAGAFYWHRWWPGLHLSALALSLFIVYLGYWPSMGLDHKHIVAAGLAALAATIAVERTVPTLSAAASPLIAYALSVTFAALFAMQFIESPGQLKFVVVAAASLALLIGAIGYGWLFEHRGILWLGYIGFSIEVLAIYWKTVGSLLSTSVFFLSAGLLVAALAGAALWISRRSESAGAPA